MDDLRSSTEKRARRRHQWPLGGLTLLVAVVTVVAVMLLRDDPEAPGTDGGITVPGFGNPVGSAAPDFATTLLDGTRFSLSNHLATDGRPVLLNLWASWCGPCRVEMPHLDAAAKTHTDVYFLGVAVDDDPAAARAFAEEIGVTYPLAIDEGNHVGQRFPSFGLPATFLIDEEGRIVRTVYGQVSEAQIEAFLQSLAEHADS